MTTMEFYYLAVCVGAVCVFAVALGYNSWSWKTWDRSQAPNQKSEVPASHTHAGKLAA